MLKKLCVLLAGLVISTAGASCVYASEKMDEDAEYRRVTLAGLVSESQRDKIFLYRAPNQYSPNPDDHFAIGDGSPLELEPLGPSVGDVIGV